MMTKTNLVENLARSLVTEEENFDVATSAYFSRVIEQSDLLFKKVPEYEKVILGLSKKYKSSKIEIDKLTDFFANRIKYESPNRKDNYEKKKIEQPADTQMGYCIKTRVRIPFDIQHRFHKRH